MGVATVARVFGTACAVAGLSLTWGCAAGSGPGVYREPGTVSVVTADGVYTIPMGVETRGDRQVALSPDAAWRVLPRVYEALDVDTDILVPAQRRIGVTQHRFSGQILKRSASDFFDCGMDPGLTAPLADRATIMASLTTEVVADGEGSQLRTTFTGTARRPGGAAGIATCRSLGLMEVLIATMVEELAGG